MSQGKRAPNGICDYCMERVAFKTLGDSSEVCEECHKEDPTVAGPGNPPPIPTMRLPYGSRVRVLRGMAGDTWPHIEGPKPRTADKYAPCKCGSGKKFKFCCMGK